ncbi:MAG: arylesterase [Cytophagales bacterium]|nr:arylesterase [Cytophagales bacterium]
MHTSVRSLKNKTCALLTALIALAACTSKTDNATTTASGEATSQSATPASVTEKRNILIFGNSLAAGYGLDPAEAFPSLVQQRIDSLNLPYRVIGSGLSGETSAGGLARIGWVLRQPVDVFVLELGANDGLRGLDLAATRRNLQAIMDTVRAKNPDVKLVLAGMQMPPNLGKKYTTDFKSLFPELAQKNNATLIPFLLEGVAGIPALNQPDGIHPTAEGHRIVAENVWAVLKPLLELGS